MAYLYFWGQKMKQLTKRQREVLEFYSTNTTSETACAPFGIDFQVSVNLARLGILNSKYNSYHGVVFWIRQTDEEQSGYYETLIFSVYGSFQMPNKENFFICRVKDRCDWTKIVVPALKRLVKKLEIIKPKVRGEISRTDWWTDSVHHSVWENPAHVRFDFNGIEFIELPVEVKL